MCVSIHCALNSLTRFTRKTQKETQSFTSREPNGADFKLFGLGFYAALTASRYDSFLQCKQTLNWMSENYTKWSLEGFGRACSCYVSWSHWNCQIREKENGITEKTGKLQTIDHLKTKKIIKYGADILAAIPQIVSTLLFNWNLCKAKHSLHAT